MCNHYQQHPEAISSWAEWAGYRKAAVPETAQRDIWPKRAAQVAHREGGEKLITTMSWGVPVTLPGKRTGTTLTKAVTNVRNTASPFWKGSLARPEQRCLVPFSAFAEPRPGKDPASGRPAEYWFSLSNGEAGAFAGLWRTIGDSRVFAFLTCEPNALVAPLHPKAMPVILQPDDYDLWLEGGFEEVVALQAPYPSQLMQLIE